MGDYIRWAPPYYGTDEQQALGTRSSLYLSLNRGKRSVRLDLKNEAGKEALLRLVAAHDVVLDGFRPGVLDRLGVGYGRIQRPRPRQRRLLGGPGPDICIMGPGQDGCHGGPGYDYCNGQRGWGKSHRCDTGPRR